MNRIGDVILTARRAVGMTQDELVTALGVTQAALSRYENNLRMPEPEIIDRLAEVLGLTREFLTHPFSLQGAIAADAHMRRQATAKSSEWKRAEARLNLLRMQSSFLLERVGMTPSNSIPTFDPDEISPDDAARLVRAQWRLPIGPVRNLTRWLESAGILVIEQDFGTHRIDGLSQWASQYPVIIVNTNHAMDRRRLTLAHELGHLVLHSNYTQLDMEEQANSFAAEFLMPEHLITRQLVDLKLARLINLKAEWGVSVQALYERAYKMGRVGSAERQRFYKYLNSRGYKTNEPGSDRIPTEKPELASSIGASMLASGLTREEVNHLVGSLSTEHASNFMPQDRGLRVIR
jgi:Zn-dependent peptidase ImmA (M78 family)/plasmid maintenance system antidote protein VapI